MRESYADEQRRRNGLPPRAGKRVTGDTVYFTFTVDSTRAERALNRLAKAFNLRCLHDLLPDMCHHCKEKRRG